MQQFQKTSLIQEQRFKLTPQLLQSISIMAMPIVELRTRIEEELERNPALDVAVEPPSLSYDEHPVGARNDDVTEYFENTSDPGYGGYDDEAGDNKRRFMEGALARPESLQEHLLWQLRLQPLSAAEFRVGELLIRNLDENGFHREAPETVVDPADRPLIAAVAELIAGFEPTGTCVAGYLESLLAQARLSPAAPDVTELVIRDHLEDLNKGRLKEVAKACAVDIETVEEALEFIRTLNPFPGREYSTDSPQFVVPDLMVEMREGQFVIIMNDEEIPVLGVNPFFDHLLHDQAKNVRKFVQTNVRDARWFIQAIEQRNNTLLRVAKAIVEFQRDFFVRGPKHLVPLTLKDIAGEIGVHEATVSRLTNGKYIQTEWGVFELKHFFSNSISGTGSSGSRFSKGGVKEILREILAESSAADHSDQKLAELLERRGIRIARRTVAKYRKELDIASSYER